MPDVDIDAGSRVLPVLPGKLLQARHESRIEHFSMDLKEET